MTNTSGKSMISTRVEKNVSKEFRKYCAINEITQQDCIYEFILDCIKENDQYKQYSKKQKENV